MTNTTNMFHIHSVRWSSSREAEKSMFVVSVGVFLPVSLYRPADVVQIGHCSQRKSEFFTSCDWVGSIWIFFLKLHSQIYFSTRSICAFAKISEIFISSAKVNFNSLINFIFSSHLSGKVYVTTISNAHKTQHRNSFSMKENI